MNAPEIKPSGMPPASPGVAPTRPRSAKILDEHLDRLAVVYVRQSSPQQVLLHRESRERQYALVDHAVALGWSRDRVLVIDEDQGHSGKSAEHRGGFHRLLAEVAMEHVGLVLGLEMSRLARSSTDWHHLLEMCALFGTILADEDGVYDPGDSNDRLLLGLKGTISEFELVTMHNRLERGKLNKAQRGELFYCVPTGYVKVSPDRVALDPDEQVRDVIRLVFDKYDELGTLWGVFRYLLDKHIRLGIRPHAGANRGQLEWHRPTLLTVHQILRHPIYAGVYAYGRQRKKPSRTTPGSDPQTDSTLDGRRWKVFQRDRLPAYITWDRYRANQERLRQNRCLPDTPGTPRQGAALLAGLIRCGTCGHRFRSHYQRNRQAAYSCESHLIAGTARTCYGFRAAVVDELVSGQVLRALEPAALELSLHALVAIEQERARLDRHWQQRLERTRYESRQAEIRYRAVEPENRLVARTLEGCWEDALRRERELADEHDRFRQEQPLRLSPADRAMIEQLSADIPRLWHAAGTTTADRKAIIRHLVAEVVVVAKKESEHVDVTIHWQGGFTSRHVVQRPVGVYEQLRDYDRLRDRLLTLWREGSTAPQIARQLNDEGFTPPRRRCAFSGGLVRQLLYRSGHTPERMSAVHLDPGEWWLTELAEKLRVPVWKLRNWAGYGWLHARQTAARKRWIVWADAEEVARLRKLKARSKHGQSDYPSELTTPKKRGKK